jgi:hypothetical protein
MTLGWTNNESWIEFQHGQDIILHHTPTCRYEMGTWDSSSWVKHAKHEAEKVPPSSVEI